VRLCCDLLAQRAARELFDGQFAVDAHGGYYASGCGYDNLRAGERHARAPRQIPRRIDARRIGLAEVADLNSTIFQ